MEMWGGSLKAAGLGDGSTWVAGSTLMPSQAIPKLRLRPPPRHFQAERKVYEGPRST